MAENERRVTEVREVHSGWSTFWKWVGTIVVVLLIGMIIIYVANTFLLGESMRTQAISGNSDGDGAQIDLNISDGDSADSGSDN